MSLCRVSELPLDKMLNFDRSGIVPCKLENGEIIMGFGVDTKSGDISTFAGKPIMKDGGPIGAAVREWDEETHGAFGGLSPNSLSDSYCIYNDAEIIIFVMTNWNNEEVCRKFQKKRKASSEMSELCFFNPKSFMKMLDECGDGSDASVRHKMYDRVRNLFVSAILNHGFFMLFAEGGGLKAVPALVPAAGHSH